MPPQTCLEDFNRLSMNGWRNVDTQGSIKQDLHALRGIVIAFSASVLKTNNIRLQVSLQASCFCLKSLFRRYSCSKLLEGAREWLDLFGYLRETTAPEDWSMEELAVQSILVGRSHNMSIVKVGSSNDIGWNG